ncbi:acetylornithine/succinylornithine family transaminase [Arenicella xantha]
MNAYARLPVSFVRGEACTLWDADGKQYLDALGGIAVTFLGHCHPRISQTISLQATKLLHTSNLFHIQEQAQLGEKFCKISGMDKVFFGNSGAEANEAAIKIARLHARTKGIERPAIITMNHAFHGRTMATLSASGNPNIQRGFEPLVEEFIHVEFNNIDAISAYASNPNVVAVMLEPIQGEGGILVPDAGYLAAVREICDQHGWLLILDEIQTGIGRTGKWFAHQHEGIQPDVLTSAKALGNGIPIGACAARGSAAELIGPGSHGTTFGGNPFASQVGNAVIDIITEENLIERADQIGCYLKKQLQQHLGIIEKVVDIRGRGLMLGIELDNAYPNLAMTFLEQGLVVNITGAGKVIRLLPSVLLTEAQAKQIAETIRDVITSL